MVKTWTVAYYVSFLLSAAVKDDTKRGHYRDKIKGYMDRAEQIKARVNQMKEGNQHNHWILNLQLRSSWNM